MNWSRSACTLALVATIFGGAVLGAGNAIQGLLSQADQHAHHHHHGSAEQTLPSVLTMPAHCLFCIDGVTPVPVSLADVTVNTPFRPALEAGRQTAEPRARHLQSPRNRSPPV